MVWKPMKNLIIFLITSHEQSSCLFSEEKRNVYIFIQVSKQRKQKNIQKQGCRVSYLEPCQISMMEHFCENTSG